MYNLSTVTVSSHQSRNLTAKEGDNVTIICTRTNGTHAEWEFLLQDGSHYFYTQNETILKIRGFSFYDLGSPVENLEDFSVTVQVNNELNSTKIRCAAKESEESDPVFNSFHDMIFVERGNTSIFHANDLQG